MKIFVDMKIYALSCKAGGEEVTILDGLSQNYSLVLKDHRVLDLSLSKCYAEYLTVNLLNRSFKKFHHLVSMLWEPLFRRP